MLLIVLFLIVIMLSFVVVRIGGIAFELTGMHSDQAAFQALSCFTGTGFTTREAELVTGHPQRRQIAGVLMVFGFAVSVALIGSLINVLQTILIVDTTLRRIPFTEIEVSTIYFSVAKFLVVMVALGVVFRFFMRSRIWVWIQHFIRKRMKRMGIITPVAFEELIVGEKGYGIIKLKVSEESELCGKDLVKSELRSKYDIQVLAIEREDDIIPNPKAEEKIQPDDGLLCFGPRREVYENLKRLC